MKSKRNDPASVLLVDLRKAMKMTQQEFAVQVLQGAITTVSRYESGNPPPRGEVLFRLSDIAHKHGLRELSSQFRVLYLEDVLKAVGSQVTVIPPTETAPGRGFITTSLANAWAVRIASALLFIAKTTPDLIPAKQREALDAAAESFEAAAWMGTVFAKKGKR
jgi:transcriptional regulator with XRE-family HTH domain